MKLRQLALSACLAALFSSAAIASAEERIYINENMGFNVEGYKYEQEAYPCNIDKVLVEQIIERGRKNNLQIEAVSTADKINNGTIPVIAIDFDALVLGSEEYTYGTKSNSNLPSVRVTAALISPQLEQGHSIAAHSCAIAHLSDLTPASSVLDLGTTHTVCSATHRCLRDLSKDIVEWVAPQVQ